MWPSGTFDVSPLYVTSYVKTFVNVSSVAGEGPVPVGETTGLAWTSAAAFIVALKVTILDTGCTTGLSEPQATMTIAVAVTKSSVLARCSMGVSCASGGRCEHVRQRPLLYRTAPHPSL